MTLSYDGAEQSENNRAIRLINLLAVVAIGNPELIQDIDRIHDHEGELTICWCVMPDRYSKNIITEIWDAVFCEPNCNHTYKDQPV